MSNLRDAIVRMAYVESFAVSFASELPNIFTAAIIPIIMTAAIAIIPITTAVFFFFGAG